jgi:hypothetical protein
MMKLAMKIKLFVAILGILAGLMASPVFFHSWHVSILDYSDSNISRIMSQQA